MKIMMEESAEIEGESGEVMWNNNGVEQPMRNAVLIPPANMLFKDIQVSIKMDRPLFPGGNTLEDHNLFLLETGNYSDTIFKLVDHNISIPAHLNFFVTRSKEFRTHLLQSTERPFTMNVAGVKSPEDFKAFLRCMYTDRLDLSLDQAVQVLLISHILGVKYLVNRCSSLLRSIISAETALCILLVACKSEQPDLKKDALDYIARFTKEVCNHSDFLESSPELLLTILKHNSLKIEEYELFKFVIKWSHTECKRLGIPVSSKQRRKILEPMLPYIRFPLMSVDELHNYVRLLDVLPNNILNQVIDYVNNVNQGDCKPNVAVGFETVRRVPTYVAFTYKTTSNQETKCYMTADKDSFFEEFRFRSNVDMELIGLCFYGSGLDTTPELIDPIEYDIFISIYGENPRQITPTPYDFTIKSHEDFEIIMQSTYPILKNCLYQVKVKIRGRRIRFGADKISEAHFALFGGDIAIVEFLERKDASSFSHRGIIRGVIFTVT